MSYGRFKKVAVQLSSQKGGYKESKCMGPEGWCEALMKRSHMLSKDCLQPGAMFLWTAGPD